MSTYSDTGKFRANFEAFFRVACRPLLKLSSEWHVVRFGAVKETGIIHVLTANKVWESGCGAMFTPDEKGCLQ